MTWNPPASKTLGGRAKEEPRPPGDVLVDAVRAGEFPRTTSVIAFQHGEQLVEAYFDGTNADTLHDIRSVTKSLAALAVGLAITDGVVPSVDAPAFSYLSELRPFAHDSPEKQAITIEDLMTMSSALDCNDNVVDSPGNEENMYPKRGWSRFAVDLPVRALPVGSSKHGVSGGGCAAGRDPRATGSVCEASDFARSWCVDPRASSVLAPRGGCRLHAHLRRSADRV